MNNCSSGTTGALFLPFDNSIIPQHRKRYQPLVNNVESFWQESRSADSGKVSDRTCIRDGDYQPAKLILRVSMSAHFTASSLRSPVPPHILQGAELNSGRSGYWGTQSVSSM